MYLNTADVQKLLLHVYYYKSLVVPIIDPRKRDLRYHSFSVEKLAFISSLFMVRNYLNMHMHKCNWLKST